MTSMSIPPLRVLAVSALLLLSFSSQDVTCYTTAAFSTTRGSTRRSALLAMSMQQQPKGCAATPLQKKSVAIFGAGGYVGGCIFGFCQRASNLYGTGIGGSAIPRSISATAEGSLCLNRVLSKAFKLAYAGEQHMRLCYMEDVEHITERIRSMDAVFVGTVHQLEIRSVTGNTYELTPNDKTNEFYLDERKVIGMGEITAELDVHLNTFRNIIDACKAADVSHVVVIETPNTPNAEPFARILDAAGLPFTYIYTSKGSEWAYSKDWTFEKGVIGSDTLRLQHATLAEDYLSKSGYEPGDWAETLPNSSSGTDGGGIVYREDIAAVAVQSLMSLDWARSRCIEVSNCGGEEEDAAEEPKAFRSTRPTRSDREWCVKSGALAQMLTVVE